MYSWAKGASDWKKRTVKNLFTDIAKWRRQGVVTCLQDPKHWRWAAPSFKNLLLKLNLCTHVCGSVCKVSHIDGEVVSSKPYVFVWYWELDILTNLQESHGIFEPQKALNLYFFFQGAAQWGAWDNKPEGWESRRCRLPEHRPPEPQTRAQWVPSATDRVWRTQGQCKWFSLLQKWRLKQQQNMHRL